MSIYLLPYLLLMCAIISIIVPLSRYMKENKLTRTFPSLTAAGLFFLCTGLLMMSIEKAEDKGMQPNATVQVFVEGFASSPVEDQLPDNLSNILFVYYRYDCPDCHAVMGEVEDLLKDYPVYYVCSRSEQGQSLLQKYPVSYVPTIGYITKSGSVFYNFPLAVTDSDGAVVVNTSGLDEILELYQSHNPI